MKRFDVLAMGDADKLHLEIFLRREFLLPQLEYTVTFFQTHRLALLHLHSSAMQPTGETIEGVILRMIMQS